MRSERERDDSTATTATESALKQTFSLLLFYDKSLAGLA